MTLFTEWDVLLSPLRPQGGGVALIRWVRFHVLGSAGANHVCDRRSKLFPLIPSFSPSYSVGFPCLKRAKGNYAILGFVNGLKPWFS